MKAVQILALLLAVSCALNVAVAAAIVAQRGGKDLCQSLLVGGGAAASALTIYFAAVAAYR